MKMKEVITETGLTDRAIRLYIENGLVAPSCSENYAGRKNIEFTDDDVVKLRNIATLRKAGFSIGEIKLMLSGKASCRITLEEFIAKTSERIESDKAVLEKLEAVVMTEEISVDTICESLNSVTEEKEVPTEDTQVSLISKIARVFFLCVGSLTLIPAIIFAAMIYYEESYAWFNYLYPSYELSFDLLWLGAPILSIALSLYLILTYRKNKFLVKKKQRIKNIVSVTLTAILAFSIFQSFALSIVISWGEGCPIAESRTTDIENYMIFDADKAKDVLSEFLPETLPDYKNVRYEYEYETYGVHYEPPQTEIFLELELYETTFYSTVEKYKNFRPADSVNEPEIQQRENGWTVILYREDYERAPSNYAPVFAYNENRKTVRFICEYGRVSSKGTHSLNSVNNYYW